MSEPKKSGLFVNKKSQTPSGGAPTSPLAGARPKDVKKRWMYVGVGTVAAVIATSTLMGGKSEPIRATGPAKNAAGPMINVTPANADKAAFEANFSKELERLRQEQDRLKEEMARKDRQIDDLKNAPPAAGTLPPGVVPPPTLNGVTTPPPPALPILTPPQAASAPAASPATPPSLPSSVPVITPPSGGGSVAPQSSEPIVFDAPGAGASSAPSSAAGNGVTAKTRYTKNANAGMLPAGSFASIAILNGLDAGTSSATQSNPMPVLMNVTNQAILPGAAKYRLRNCFVLGTGYGDLSAERVYVRISRLSCVDKADRLVLSQEVQGYLVDSDGKLGLRGTVTDRQGAKLGKALLAGFAQGLSSALGSAQGTITNNASTGQTLSSLTGGATLRSAGLQGAQTATSQLAEFYLKEAQSIFPVISVDAGRTGTIVFSGSANLNWSNGESQFVQQVTPSR